MKLLVTGGAGYIGSHTTHRLIEAGHEVVVLDNFCSGFRWAIPAGAELIEGQIGDVARLTNIFSVHHFDGLLHFAAHIDVSESVRDPIKYYINNAVHALTLFKIAAKSGTRNVVLSSTAAVYGDVLSDKPVAEDSFLNPMNPYGASKAMAERFLQDLAASMKGDLRYIILRYFNAAGARCDLKIGQATPGTSHLIRAASEVALGRREKLVIFGSDYETPDGTCKRDFIHVEDLAQAHLDGLDYIKRGGKSEIFNVGYGRGTTVLQLLKVFERVNRVKIPIMFGERRVGDPVSVTADSAKIRQILGWSPRYDSLELICETAFEWEKKLQNYSDLAPIASVI